MCVTNLHGVYCDGVFPYLLVMANFVYMWEVYCLWYILSVCNINMSCIFNILRFLSKGSVCALYVLIITYFWCVRKSHAVTLSMYCYHFITIGASGRFF